MVGLDGMSLLETPWLMKRLTCWPVMMVVRVISGRGNFLVGLSAMSICRKCRDMGSTLYMNRKYVVHSTTDMHMQAAFPPYITPRDFRTVDSPF